MSQHGSRLPAATLSHLLKAALALAMRFQALLNMAEGHFQIRVISKFVAVTRHLSPVTCRPVSPGGDPPARALCTAAARQVMRQLRWACLTPLLGRPHHRGRLMCMCGPGPCCVPVGGFQELLVYGVPLTPYPPTQPQLLLYKLV